MQGLQEALPARHRLTAEELSLHIVIAHAAAGQAGTAPLQSCMGGTAPVTPRAGGLRERLQREGLHGCSRARGGDSQQQTLQS